MFWVLSKAKIESYLISLTTVSLLFVMSFAITKANNETIKVSANTYNINKVGENSIIIETNKN